MRSSADCTANAKAPRRPLCDLQDFGPKHLKGIGGPVRAWGVLRPASVESRFEALHAGALTELVDQSTTPPGGLHGQARTVDHPQNGRAQHSPRTRARVKI